MKFTNFVLCTEKCYLFNENGITFPCVIQKYTKFANFTGLYFFSRQLFHHISHPNLTILPTLGCSLIINAVVVMNCTIFSVQCLTTLRFRFDLLYGDSTCSGCLLVAGVNIHMCTRGIADRVHVATTSSYHTADHGGRH